MRGLNKIVSIVTICIISSMLLCGCGNTKQGKISVNDKEENTNNTYKPTNENAKEESKEDDSIRLPLDNSSISLTFSSGAGGWRTTMILNNDGTFEGCYSDSEAGDSGEEYPYGSVYYCNFSGKFKDIKKINDYSYSMTLDNISTNNRGDYIEDNIRYVASDPYGMESVTEFIFYTTDTPFTELSEDLLSWCPNYYLYQQGTLTTLDCYGLYNKEMGYGFFSLY